MEILRMGREELLTLKPEDISRFLTPEEVLHIAKIFGAWWAYDYDAARQGRVGMHARLKSGLCSNGFFVSKILLAAESIRLIFSNQMAMLLKPVFERLGKTDWITGVPDGATRIGEDLGEIFQIKVAKMEKIDGEISLATSVGFGDTITVVEDFCTRGTGFSEAVRAIKTKQPMANISPYNPVILNRGGLAKFDVDLETFTILPIVNWRVKDWEPDKCPLCKMGSVPIKPKEIDDNWLKLINSQK